jgi:cell division protein FtsB
MSNDQLKHESRTNPVPNPPAPTNGGKEDKKAAIQLWTTVSTQLITATLAMMAVQGAFVTFFFDKRKPTTAFYVLSVVTLILFILSIGFAAKGIGDLAQSGYGGEWKKELAVPRFFQQTVLCLLGLLVFFTSLLFSGPSKESESEKLVRQLQQQVETLKQDETSNKQALEQLRQDYQSLQERVRQQIERLNTPSAKPGSESK